LLSPADSLAPEWLVVPDDVNDLPAAVWPASAGRTVDGVLTLSGISAASLAETYGTPLLVLDEDEVRGRARAFRTAFDAAAADHDTTAQVYYAG
jgi:diaminopimelate decarboxylase